MIKECAYWEDFSYILLFREDTKKESNKKTEKIWYVINPR
jgi:hypothetical protein